MNEEHFQEIFDYPIRQFTEHLETQVNERILFSGKFGIGKTSFLKHFFNKDTQVKYFSSHKFIPIYLFPVNYSVATNEDIIRYIKYDIIIELIKKNIPVEEIALRFIDTLPLYAKKSAIKIIGSFLYLVPKIGKDLSTLYEKLEKLREDFLKFHAEITETDADKMVEYLNNLELTEGSIYENDIITKSISKSIEQLKTECGIKEATDDENRSEVVLVIDDLDRLDPEHVFRLFNVFASHFDSYEKEGKKNKFGFDKVMFVCDIWNVRNIFHHKYGLEVDFNGYIDKFYSSEIYHFDNKKAIMAICEKVFYSLQLKGIQRSREDFFRELLFAPGDFLFDVIMLFLQLGILNLRNIIRLKGKILNYHNERFAFNKNNVEMEIYKVPILMQLKFLNDLLGDYNHLKKAFEIASSSLEELENYKNFTPYLIYLVEINEHKFFRKSGYRSTFEGLDLWVNSQEKFSNDIKEVTLHDFEATENGSKVSGENKTNPSKNVFWKACLESINILHSKGFLH